MANQTQQTSHHSGVLLNEYQLRLTIRRLALQLTEEDTEDLHNDVVYIGLQPRGIFISDAIVKAIEQEGKRKVSYGKLDITFYRDDVYREIHKANQTEISFSVENKIVVLIDDVLHTGRTVRAALDALQAFGRPRVVKLCVLVNRSFGREVPVQPDYSGITIDTLPNQKVKVQPDKNQVILYT
ncbi:MAG: bifunctional pyr operon transcriptional regulator/uracil phosphoribosyltransferase PyrR [Ferruginibacter sp.]